MFSFDRKAPQQPSHVQARKAERFYSSRLLQIARHVGELIDGVALDDPIAINSLVARYRRYGDIIRPWAQSVAERMLADVDQADARGWRALSADMGRLVRAEIETAPTGAAMRALLAEQVGLITSLPTDAAERVQRLATESLINGGRAKAIAEEIMRTGEVAKSRAMMIARTEVSRAQTTFSMVRAQHVGSTTFIWRTSGDSDVRPTHKHLNGKSFRWDTPPECDPGYHALPGAIWNCFPGDVKIGLGNGVKRIFRSHYTGKIVDIGGIQTISATANHPVMTNRGWVPAGEVNKGDYLVYPVDHADFIVDADINQLHPTFEQVFSTFSVIGHETACGVKFNFHGDVADGNVDLINFDDPLSDDIMADIAQGARNLVFARSDRGIVASVSGVTSKVAHPHHSSGCDELESVVRRHAGHADFIGAGAVADMDARANKDATDGGACDLMIGSEGEFAFPAVVGSDDVGFRQHLAIIGGPSATDDFNTSIPEFNAQDIGINPDSRSGIFACGAGTYQFHRVDDVSFRDFSGHVYTIETATGWYGVTPTAAIVKNCRCWAEPVFD